MCTRSLAALLSLFWCAPLIAGPGPKLGVPLSDADLAGIDFSVLPSGEGLPGGSGTAVEGAAVYRQHCLACHGADGTGGANDALAGGQGSLAGDNPVKTVGSYWPYATTLFDYLRRAMPYTSPGSLSDDQLYAVTAYVLSLNDIVDETTRLDRHSLPGIAMPNRDNFDRAWPADEDDEP